MICAQCHSLRDVIAPGYTAGADYYDHFLPLLEYRPQKPTIPPTGPTGGRAASRTTRSACGRAQCFLRGGATCTNCHRDPHLPDVDRNPQLAPANNALCTRCHQEIGAAVDRAHASRARESTGSSCVECHMPKTVISIKATMRDHTIGLPAPENTVAFDIPNACTECHTRQQAGVGG